MQWRGAYSTRPAAAEPSLSFYSPVSALLGVMARAGLCRAAPQAPFSWGLTARSLLGSPSRQVSFEPTPCLQDIWTLACFAVLPERWRVQTETQLGIFSP